MSDAWAFRAIPKDGIRGVSPNGAVGTFDCPRDNLCLHRIRHAYDCDRDRPGMGTMSLDGRVCSCSELKNKRKWQCADEVVFITTFPPGQRLQFAHLCILEHSHDSLASIQKSKALSIDAHARLVTTLVTSRSSQGVQSITGSIDNHLTHHHLVNRHCHLPFRGGQLGTRLGSCFGLVIASASRAIAARRIARGTE